LELDSQFDEALATYEEMAGLTDEPSIELASLMARVTIYAVPTSVHNSAQALALGERALALARELSDQQAEAKILWSLSLANFFGSRAAQAIECGERSLALARELGLREQMAQTLNDLGSFCYLYSGSIDRAKSSLREASDLWRELGNLPMLADSLSSSCVTCVYGGEYDQAVALSEEALQISQSIDNLWGQSYSQWLVGVAYWERGEFSRAIAVMEESIRLGELAGFVPPQDHTRAYLAALYGDLGALDRGLEAVRLALSVAETKNPTGRIHALGILAHLYQMSGELTKAARVIEEGKLDPYREAWPVFYISVVVAEAELALKLADYERAVDVTDTLLARLAEFGMRAFTPYARYLQGQALLGLNRKNAARERWLESRDEAEAIGSRRTLWRVLNALSQLEGDLTEAERLRQEAQHVIEYIAEHIDCAELRESFLNLPDVQAVLEPASDD
jgi:tetratricopeptide (TPR) repeat protein